MAIYVSNSYKANEGKDGEGLGQTSVLYNPMQIKLSQKENIRLRPSFSFPGVSGPVHVLCFLPRGMKLLQYCVFSPSNAKLATKITERTAWAKMYHFKYKQK